MEAAGEKLKDQQIRSRLTYQEKLLEITNQLHGARNLTEILLEVKDKILDLFDADRITVYAIDLRRNQIYSKFKVGNEVREIRLPIDGSSIAGYVAQSKKPVNIQNAYDSNELRSISPSLKFDKRWDQKTGYNTRQILAVPMIFERAGKHVFGGVVQLVNKKRGPRFTAEDQKSLEKVASILGLAINNQQKMLRRVPTKFDYLLDQHLISEEELNAAIGKAKDNKKPPEDVLREDYKISKEDMLKALSNYYRIPYVIYDDGLDPDPELSRGLRLDYLLRRHWVPLQRINGRAVVLIDDPNDLAKVDEIRANMQLRNCEFRVALREDIDTFIKHLMGLPKKEREDEIHGAGEEESAVSISDIISGMETEDVEEEEEDDLFDQLTERDSSVVKLANQIIREAYKVSASDIHIEPYGKKDMVVRLRIDGACMNYLKVPASYARALVSRYKIMSQLDIAERRKPQDGKIKFKMPGKQIELRVATIPTAGGNEDVVMRILASNEPIPLDRLGLSSRNYKAFVECITKPYGIVMVVGPTGSGKTTTLHSALGYINTPEKKIWTAEDPVEITQYGLRQVQVHPKIGFTFAAAMRAFLRADPDVIMVGEMRDEETAGIGIEASLTGHLVFSTLHTNSAPETITRLLDMGMDPFNFSDALIGVLAQRLVRTLCKECKEPYHPSKEEFDLIAADYGERWFTELNIEYSDRLTLYRPVGCSKCNNTGYKGRMGIHELLVATDRIKTAIQKKSLVEEIRQAAMEDGMRTLLQDGIAKVFQGFTDYKHVRGVCIK